MSRRSLSLAVEVWSTFLRVQFAVRRCPLPEVVESLKGVDERRDHSLSPVELSAAVDRRLTFGTRRPRCLLNALVLFRLLRARRQPAQLVIGLPAEARTQAAHAWVELGSRDIGPPPGRNGHVPLARFG